jgi:hypothetical protein
MSTTKRIRILQTQPDLVINNATDPGYNNLTNVLVTKQNDYNDKIALNNKYPYFLINGFSLIILHLFSWIIALVV